MRDDEIVTLFWKRSEDVTYFLDNIYPVVKGGKYVLPLYEYGDTIQTFHEWAGGDISRESIYSTIYPYHPQIEVTADESFIIPASALISCIFFIFRYNNYIGFFWITGVLLNHVQEYKGKYGQYIYNQTGWT